MAFTLIIGPMKSGKSLELISRVAPYEFAAQKVLYVQPTKNVRDEGICSRLGVNTKALAVDSLGELIDSFDVIGIDEVHMFPVADANIIRAWVEAGRTVFVSGLDLDYRSRVPPIVQKLYEVKPETIIAKLAVCELCHAYSAQFTQIVCKGKAVLKGLPTVVPEDGTYEYQARCRSCFKRA